MKRALLSVTDKTGVVDFGKGLAALGYELISTGGTAKTLREAGLMVTEVADVTGFPEMLDGRVKTLHPMVHGGLLGDLRLEKHREEMEAVGIAPISILCVNLYAFEAAISKPHDLEEAIEGIDIGGPAMIRAASKNHANVAVVVDPADYDAILQEASGTISDATKLKLAAKAFRHTAVYDSVISRYLGGVAGESSLTENFTAGMRRVQSLRYGENPHQTAALYRDPLQQGGIAQAKVLWGKEVSYNNLLDADAAWELVQDLPGHACTIIKHGNPCGAAALIHGGDSYRAARESDPISAFGGIAAFREPIDQATAEAMTEKGNFLEVVIGPSFTPEAMEVFKNRAGWGQDVRLLEAKPSPSHRTTIRSIGGGAVIQDADRDPGSDWRVVTRVGPSDEQFRALRFQWTVARHVKSNAIVVGGEDRLYGVGAGQMNRVQSVRLALEGAGERVKGAVLASDAFFPFPDSIETAAAAGISAVVQPGGSKKDADVIEAADRLGIAMVLTGVRHFRH